MDDLDAKLAEKLFGWRFGQMHKALNMKCWLDEKGAPQNLPHWSSTWEGAGEVIEAMCQQPFDTAVLFREALMEIIGEDMTAFRPGAIAKAALEALEAEE